MEFIIINGYTNATLNFLPALPNLKRVIIGRKGFNASTHLRKIVESLKHKKVNVRVFNGNIQYR